MPLTIFLSWQSDTPKSTGHYFLRDALKEACRAIGKDTTLDEAQREKLSVDSDTRGVPGQARIVETIFEKIDASAVLVADMTFTAKRHDAGGYSPNPNVLIEYGWALKSLSHDRVISVMNTAYGEPSKETIPFDMAHIRFPIPYSLREGASQDVKSEQKKLLVKALKEAILLCLRKSKPAAIEADVLEGGESFHNNSSEWYPVASLKVRNCGHRALKDCLVRITEIAGTPPEGMRLPVRLRTQDQFKTNDRKDRFYLSPGQVAIIPVLLDSHYNGVYWTAFERWPDDPKWSFLNENDDSYDFPIAPIKLTVTIYGGPTALSVPLSIDEAGNATIVPAGD